EARRYIEELLYYAECGPSPIDEPAINRLPVDNSDVPTTPEGPLNPAGREPRLYPGQCLASRYEVISGPLEGAMGQVYRAHDIEFDQDVALKLLPPEFAGDPEWLSRFKREAQVLAALRDHPNICAVYDIRHDDIDYIVMEYIEGETLRA